MTRPSSGGSVMTRTLPPSTSKRHWKMRTNPAFCSLRCATSPKPRASPKLPRPPASSERVSTGRCPSAATLVCPRWLPSPRPLGSDSPSKPLHDSRFNLLSGSDGRRSAGSENQFLTLGAPQPALSRLRLANRLRSVQRQSFPGACRGAIYSRPRGASPPRDLPGGIHRLSQEERHCLRRTLHLVVISFAPDGDRARSGCLFPTARAVGYDLSPVS